MTSRQWLAGALLAFTALGYAQDDINSFVGSEPMVRNEEDRIRGKANVENVVEELRTLLHQPSKALGVRPESLGEQPEFVEIPDVNGRASLIYYCRNTLAAKLATTLDPLCSNDGYVEYNSEQNKILIVDSAERMETFKKTIAALDSMAPQVLVEGKVIEVLLTDDMQRNLSVSVRDRQQSFNAKGEDATVTSQAGSMNNAIGQSPSDAGAVFNWFPYAGDSTNMNVTFQWLQEAQDAKILSAPNIMISRGDTATINTGQDIPIQEQSQNGTAISFSTTYRNIGVTLRVTPKIVNKKSVLLNIKPEVSNVLQYETITAANVSYKVPIISIRSVDTNLTLFDGQVILLGGLYNTREVINQERTPFFSDIPWVGELFTAKNSTKEIVQLLFILRVTILSESELRDGVVFDPQQQAAEIEKIGDIVKDDQTFPPTSTTMDQVREELQNAPGMRAFGDDGGTAEK
ncbi:MAG: hypothetical protein PHI85_02575 [Victivallaceae bacterium]|nr:hypothetical protein [Victivallaceae bacterium]